MDFVELRLELLRQGQEYARKHGLIGNSAELAAWQFAFGMLLEETRKLYRGAESAQQNLEGILQKVEQSRPAEEWTPEERMRNAG